MACNPNTWGIGTIINYKQLWVMFPLQEKEKTFSSGNPWPNGISQPESMVHFVNHSLAQCGLKCLTAISCQAFTYEESTHPICSLHDKLLEIDHYQHVSKPTAKYFQRVSFKSY